MSSNFEKINVESGEIRGFKSPPSHQSRNPHEHWKIRCPCGFFVVWEISEPIESVKECFLVLRQNSIELKCVGDSCRRKGDTDVKVQERRFDLAARFLLVSTKKPPAPADRNRRLRFVV